MHAQQPSLSYDITCPVQFLEFKEADVTGSKVKKRRGGPLSDIKHSEGVNSNEGSSRVGGRDSQSATSTRKTVSRA